jgi:hypothetical protein
LPIDKLLERPPNPRAGKFDYDGKMPGFLQDPLVSPDWFFLSSFRGKGAGQWPIIKTEGCNTERRVLDAKDIHVVLRRSAIDRKADFIH